MALESHDGQLVALSLAESLDAFENTIATAATTINTALTIIAAASQGFHQNALNTIGAIILVAYPPTNAKPYA